MEPVKTTDAAKERAVEDKMFHWLIVLITLAFLWVITPLYGAILWAVVAAVLFLGMHRKILGRLKRPNLAALLSVVIILVIVILPLTILTISVVDEASTFYEKIKSCDLNLGEKIQKAFTKMPAWASGWLDRLHLSNLSDLKERIAGGVAKASQFVVAQAITLGQSTFDFLLNLFVMLYLLFFLLRDRDELLNHIQRSIPLRREHKDKLIHQLNVVIRATVKGNMIVALLQGGLGGVIFWILGIQGALLWGVVMAVLSLLPAVGAAMVWLPVAIYLLGSGAVGKGIVLMLFGGIVISLVDNVVRPILVGKETKMPDYMVLITTLGGIAIFGINGFVLGPVIAALFMTVWEIYTASRTQAVVLQ